jgi:hypothetical protein
MANFAELVSGAGDAPPDFGPQTMSGRYPAAVVGGQIPTRYQSRRRPPKLAEGGQTHVRSGHGLWKPELTIDDLTDLSTQSTGPIRQRRHPAAWPLDRVAFVKRLDELSAVSATT